MPHLKYDTKFQLIVLKADKYTMEVAGKGYQKDGRNGYPMVWDEQCLINLVKQRLGKVITPCCEYTRNVNKGKRKELYKLK